jgi:hypothetical protein
VIDVPIRLHVAGVKEDWNDLIIEAEVIEVVEVADDVAEVVNSLSRRNP